MCSEATKKIIMSNSALDPSSCPYNFTENDVVLLGRIINKGFQSGLFSADEAVVIAPLYQKIITSISQQQSEGQTNVFAAKPLTIGSTTKINSQ